MTIQTSDNKFGVSKWIVDPVPGLGTHTTIPSALSDAVSGETIFIRPGTYSDNFTLKDGVNLTSFPFEGNEDQVVVLGKVTGTYEGFVGITGIKFETSEDHLLEISGSSPTQLSFLSCDFTISDNDGILFSSSSSSSQIKFLNCCFFLTGDTFKVVDHSSSGSFLVNQCTLENTNVYTTPSTQSAGIWRFNSCLWAAAITTSGTSLFTSVETTFTMTDAPSLVIGGTPGGAEGNALNRSTLSVNVTPLTVNSSLSARSTLLVSNADPLVNGSGTLTYDIITSGTGEGIISPTSVSSQWQYTGGVSFDEGTNVLDYYETDSWTPSLEFGGGSTGITYTTQIGTYTRIGNFIHAQCQLILSSKGTDTGAATISGLPFAASGDSVGTATWGSIDLDVSGGYYYLSPNLGDSSQALTLQENGDNVAIASLTDADFGNTSSITVSIQYMVA